MPVRNSAPLGELFWCHFRGWSRYFSLIIMFRNGATEEPKQCHIAERGAVFKKRLKTVPGWSQNGASEEPKQCLFWRKGAVSKLFLKTAPLRSCFGASEEPFWKIVPPWREEPFFFLNMIIKEKNGSTSHKGTNFQNGSSREPF